MKKKEAKELDAILSVFTPNAWIAEASEEEMPACYKLADMGMIEILNRERRVIRLTDKRNSFKAQRGFLKGYYERLFKRLSMIVGFAASLATIMGVIKCSA